MQKKKKMPRLDNGQGRGKNLKIDLNSNSVHIREM